MRQSHGRNDTIDVLRGLAITMVLLLHFSLTYQLQDGPLGYLFGVDAVAAVVIWGNFGVTMFFVVSGYLITRHTLQRYGSLERVDLRAFYIFRIARIQPCLLLALAVIVAFGLSGIPIFAGKGGPAELLAGTGTVLTFTHNLLMARWGYFNYCLNVYWSLSVEETFYLLFPLACRLLRRSWRVVALCLALIVAAPLYRAAHADDDILYLYGNLACFDAIATGCLTALATHRRQPSGPTATALRAVCSLTLCAVWLRGFGEDVVASFTLIALATGGIIAGSLVDGPARWIGSVPGRAIRWLGRHSYELYLLHIIILAGMRSLVGHEALIDALQLPWLALYLTLSALVAGGVQRFIGDPVNARLRALFARRREPAVAPS
ncbi:acyltransferase family protein [Inquilinus sp. CA228]|uniref:acyltransferase family protein n=1 Tax=Inquilinus sp. CA228 TaxID=3455609 RepID=UPI003F8D87C4